MYSYILLFIIRRFAVLVSFLFVFHTSAIAQEINRASDNKDKFILALPSSDCLNCKAMSFQIIDFFKKNAHGSQLFIVTDDEAGEYYISENQNVFKEFNTIVDKSMCRFFAPHNKSTISYVNTDTITIEIKFGADSLFSVISTLKNKSEYKELAPIRIDSIYLKLNVYKDYGNYVFYSPENLFLYSKESDVACSLLNRNSIPKSIDTVELIKSILSNSKYDSLYEQLFCSETSNVPQNIMREISKNNGIPLTKIYSIANNKKQYYLLYNFFTGHSDTIRGTQKDNVNLEFVYNVSLLKSNRGFNYTPTNLSNYEIALQVTNPVLYTNKRYKVRTITDFDISDKYIFLPVALEQNSNTIDSLFFIAKFPKSAINTDKPDDIYFYQHGNFREECFYRCTNEEPILVNKIKRILDFGNSSEKISIKSLTMPLNDTLYNIYDIYPKSKDDIVIIASTKSGKVITCTLNNKTYLNNIQLLDDSKNIIHCQFLDKDIVATISKHNHMLITKQFIVPSK